MQTGENEQGLRKIVDMTRAISIIVLLLHFYFYWYTAFRSWNFYSKFSDRILLNIQRTGLFKSFNFSKIIAFGFLAVSLVGARGRKSLKITGSNVAIKIGIGMIFFFASYYLVYLQFSMTTNAILYITSTSLGFCLFLAGGTSLSRMIKNELNNKDIFNKQNETFPQEERLLENEYSINLPATYQLRSKLRNSWINIINPFRGNLVIGSPGAGKSYFVIQHIIKQHIQKGFAMFIYDFKFDDLSKIAYNYFLKYKNNYDVEPTFHVISFDDIQRAHRCNPLDPSTMHDITDAAESARTMMLSINRNWINRQGDFFVESPINFLTAVIWYLRKYQNGEFCTLPHMIEFIQLPYEKLFTILRTEPEIEVLINPFINALVNDVMDQLEGQIGGAKISVSKLSSPDLYYVLSGNDFSLDINDPEKPKIVCAGNNPQKQLVYNTVLSLYIARLIKLINKKDKLKSSLVFDEFPTIYINSIDILIATARSNKVSTTLAVQDLSQLRKDYGKEQADVIMNIAGNVVCGQVMGDTAKQMSERFGKIMQQRESISINSSDTSLSQSLQMDTAIPASKITSLSSGEFVGMVADEPNNLIELKAFHAKIINDHDQLLKERNAFVPIPPQRKIDHLIVQKNYLQIKEDVQNILHSEMDRILNDPVLSGIIIQK
ncbi:MAG: YWFCY domain-containing protein [Bacteroidetes bacterium]|nr:YWFCY domain-containing protein [Bacteroidota bacterium]